MIVSLKKGNVELIIWIYLSSPFLHTFSSEKSRITKSCIIIRSWPLGQHNDSLSFKLKPTSYKWYKPQGVTPFGNISTHCSKTNTPSHSRKNKQGFNKIKFQGILPFDPYLPLGPAQPHLLLNHLVFLNLVLMPKHSKQII